MSSYVKTVLSTLKGQLERFNRQEHRSQTVIHNRNKSTKSDDVLRGQFEFYAAQHRGIGKSVIFDDMGGVKGIMDIGSFLKLCKDF